MSFAPAIPFGGIAGFRFLEATYDRQLTLFARGPQLDRDVADFVARSGEVATAEEFVKDPRLLRVALGAFGLEDEAPKRAFVRRILEEGSIDPGSFANRLADPAWRQFAEALGFGDFGPRLVSREKRLELAEQYRVRQFERAVGDSDVSLRLALNFRREIGAIAGAEDVERSGWFRIMGSRPLRDLIEGAFGLPQGFAQLDLDRQRDILESRSSRLFGGRSPAVFLDAANVDQAITRFLTTAELTAGPSPSTPGASALSLLSSGPGSALAAGARINLILSGS